MRLSMNARWILVATAACIGRGAQVAGPPAPPSGPACITPPDVATAITHATGDANQVAYCIGSACFSLDLASGKLARLAKPPVAQPAALEAPARVETTSPDLRICAAAGCKSLAPQLWPGIATMRAATNGAFAVVLLGDAEHGNGYADVWDVGNAKKVATFRYAHGDFRCGDVAMLGETIFIGANACQGPSGRGVLYSLKGKKIASVGDQEFGTFGNVAIQIEGATWAFLEENATKIVVQEVVKGKLDRTIDTSELWRVDQKAAEAIGNPGESVLVRLGAGKLAVIAGTPANGSAAVVDVATGAVKIVRAPLCR